jgi:adenine phosphoribosyltransferase
MDIERIKKNIRNVPDFPKPGIQFKDITPILQDPELFGNVIDIFYERYKNEKIDVIVGIESRGFIFAAPLALKLCCSFVLARKSGKLPSETVCSYYDLEYGTDSLEIHKDSLQIGDNILIVDDLLATGGTTRAVIDLVNKLQGNIFEIAYLVELSDLDNKENLEEINKFSIIKL